MQSCATSRLITARSRAEEEVGAMSELVNAGEVQYLGMSEAAATIRRAHVSSAHLRATDGVLVMVA